MSDKKPAYSRKQPKLKLGPVRELGKNLMRHCIITASGPDLQKIEVHLSVRDEVSIWVEFADGVMRFNQFSLSNEAAREEVECAVRRQIHRQTSFGHKFAEKVTDKIAEALVSLKSWQSQ